MEKVLADGTVRIETNGQVLFFLLPQDVGGPALTLATGHSVLVYDINADTVTSLRSSGRTFDVCTVLG